MSKLKLAEALIAINDAERPHLKNIRKEVVRGRFRLVFEMRDPSGLMGRFGGGWNWALGFHASGSTVLLYLLVATLRLEWNHKPFRIPNTQS